MNSRNNYSWVNEKAQKAKFLKHEPFIKARELREVEDLGDELEAVGLVLVPADGDRRKGDVLDRIVGRLHRDDHRILIPLWKRCPD